MTVAAGVALAVTSWTGLRPQPVVLVLTVVGVFAVVWLMDDLGSRQDDLDLEAPRRRFTPRWGLDARFSRLAASLREPHDPQLIAQLLHSTLVPIVDERLRAQGIDRAGDPEAASAAMGSDLAEFVGSPARVRRNQIAYFAKIVTRIEAL